ncbi:MAG: HAMP domain-containing sensor histidine kinase [Caldilinea sp.]
MSEDNRCGWSPSNPGQPDAAPPWMRRSEWDRQRWRDHRGRHPGFLFLRFAALFGLFALLIFGGLGLLIYFVVRLAGGDGQTAAVVWLSTCGLILLLPLAIGLLGRRAFRSIARPLSALMNAADAVAEGDLSVRVPVQGRSEFSQLAISFNRMVEELQLADQRRRNLTADVAHELRTPLQIIQGNLEGVLDGVYTPTPEHIAATLDETQQLARLVEDLRVLSQAEAGQLPMHWERVDVAELCTDAVTSFEGQAEVSGIILRASLPDARLIVTADYGRLDQVLSNLLANAIRHTPSGGVVELSARLTAEGARIAVSDTGEGIPAEEMPYLFDRFWRGDRARAHHGGAGSGLGLAIVRQLVQAHGGRIEVSSVPGEGTTFTVYLPLAPPASQA